MVKREKKPVFNTGMLKTISYSLIIGYKMTHIFGKPHGVDRFLSNEARAVRKITFCRAKLNSYAPDSRKISHGLDTNTYTIRF